MQKQKELTVLAQRIRALSLMGSTWAQTEYDTERYAELLRISNRIAALATGISTREVALCYQNKREYVTPKVDVRAVVFDRREKILLVRERSDGLWSLPGGWADVGYSPTEVAQKEVLEETGLNVRPVRLLAVIDTRCHTHPAMPYYVYKLFILCRIIGGAFTEVFDILDKDFFSQDALPPLSLERVLPEQIDLMFRYRQNPRKMPYLD